MALRDLWFQFRNDAQASYRLYADGVAWEELKGLPRWKQYWRIAKDLFWCMIMHLSPTRRIIALISFALVVLGEVQSNLSHPKAASWGVLGLILVLALELADRVTMKRDLEIARDIQSWLVPEKPPTVSGLDIAFRTRPANTVGGDYYDAMPLGRAEPDSGRLLLVVADVAGKSVPAALLMATFQASLKALAASSDGLLDLVESLNRYVCTRSLGGQRFTTAFFAEIDPSDNGLRYVNCGHNYPVLLKKRGGMERLVTGGLPLGIRPEADYESGTLQLEPDDLLAIFTDGIVEAVNGQDEEYGDQRLLDTLGRIDRPEAEAVVAALLGDLDAFVGSTRQHDDMTCLILRVTPRQSPRPTAQKEIPEPALVS